MRNVSAGLSSDVDAASVRHRVRLLPRYVLLHVPLRLMQQMSSVLLPNLPRNRGQATITAASSQPAAHFCLELRKVFANDEQVEVPKNRLFRLTFQ
jgi:hypothetical protein